MKLENIYTSIACNRIPQSADWGKNGLIVFGARNAVALLDSTYDGNSAKIIQTYVQHTKRVNTAQWLLGDAEETEKYFLTGADDGLAILWSIEDIEEPKCYYLKGHTCGVNAVAGLQQANGEWLLATAAADSSIKLWHFDGTSVECFQTIHLKSGFCFALKLARLPKSDKYLLAFSADDESIALWVQQQENAENVNRTQFICLHRLIGHEDWVRGMDVVNDGEDLLLATSAQDNFIRLWRIAPRTAEQVQQNKVDIFELLDKETGEIRVEEKIIQVDVNAWVAVCLESVLYGHEGWVYGVHWHKSESQELRLLSASIDKTLIIWAANEDGIWMEQVRVGDVGGNSLGFFGGKFAADGRSIMGHGYQGGFHIWQQSATQAYNWQPAVVSGGHFDEVRDLAWEPKGAYLMTVSADQTTRLHAPWQRAVCNTITWHEIARPQVHGYDMQAIAMLSRYKFASGAEEKIVRTFQSSANFIENFGRLCKLQDDAEGEALLATLPKGASVPSLGLSNKAVYSVETTTTEEKHVKDEYPENYFVPVDLETPPQEETLMQNTLWPEVQKLYGHGYEIYALAASPDGDLLASSCRASNAEHAQIILWNTSNWKQVQKLPSHQLTVTQIRFSPNGQYLLSVSRDRRWSLFGREATTGVTAPMYSLIAATDKSNSVHARIIWSCDWSHDSKYFATTSRDGKVAIWMCNTDEAMAGGDPIKLNGWHALDVLELKSESITAVAFAPKTLLNGAYIVAIGNENGVIHIYQFDGKWSLLLTLTKSQSHHLSVRRLQFRPSLTETQDEFELASCGDDNLVRIYKLKL